MYAHRYWLQLLPQPPLPQVPRLGCQGVVGRARSRAPERALLPHGVHGTGRDRRFGVSEQGGDLRHPVQGVGGDDADDRRPQGRPSTVLQRSCTLAEFNTFAAWVSELRQIEWVTYAKRPFGGPEPVLAYLSRYTHRIAISNRRLVAWDDTGVTFK